MPLPVLFSYKSKLMQHECCDDDNAYVSMPRTSGVNNETATNLHLVYVSACMRL